MPPLVISPLLLIPGKWRPIVGATFLIPFLNIQQKYRHDKSVLIHLAIAAFAIINGPSNGLSVGKAVRRPLYIIYSTGTGFAYEKRN